MKIIAFWVYANQEPGLSYQSDIWPIFNPLGIHLIYEPLIGIYADPSTNWAKLKKKKNLNF